MFAGRSPLGVPTVSQPGDSDEPALLVDSLSKVYDGSDGTIRAVDDVSFTVESGSVVGVLGPNGAGKTTMIKSMLGLVLPTEGEIRVNGIDVYDDPGAAYAHVGAMLEGARNIYWRLTVRENLEYFASLVGLSPDSVRERHDELLEMFGLLEKADVLVKNLSRGMKQKVAIVSTLADRSSILFLDEPTLGLDIESSIDLRQELRQLVEYESMTVVLSSHDMDVIEDLCDRVIIMNEGNIVADDTVENLTGVFTSQAYEVTMDGRLTETMRRSIERTYVVEQYERTATGVDRFEIMLEDGDSFYDFIDSLKESGRAIAAIETIQPDLESVFLELTNRAATDAGSEVDRGDGQDSTRGGTP